MEPGEISKLNDWLPWVPNCWRRKTRRSNWRHSLTQRERNKMCFQYLPLIYLVAWRNYATASRRWKSNVTHSWSFTSRNGRPWRNSMLKSKVSRRNCKKPRKKSLPRCSELTKLQHKRRNNYDSPTSHRKRPLPSKLEIKSTCWRWRSSSRPTSSFWVPWRNASVNSIFRMETDQTK